ncbi:hypothetical protein PSTG_14930, partial [Puccinia striiformis f. sp. tritici PST-78]
MAPKTIESNTDLFATKTPVKNKLARKTPTKEAKKATPAKKQMTASQTSKKRIVTKEESESSEEEDDDNDNDEELSEEEEEDTKDTKKKKKKPNHPWTDDQRVALLAFIHDQISLGKGTDNGNLKSEGWTA